MRILLTGGTGMVGSNLREHPVLQSHTVMAPTSGELDLTDYQATASYFCDANIDLVIHAAGKVGGIQANMREPP